MTNLDQREDEVRAPEPSGAPDDSVAGAGAGEAQGAAGATDSGIDHGARAYDAGPAPKGSVPGVDDAKVMIVDDESTTVQLLQVFLEDAGYTRFVTTDRSNEAMQLLLAERPDVVLLDLNMPEVNGFDILAEARAP